PYSDAFFASVQASRQYLAQALYTELAGHSDVIATCIGHTHIDVAWWWTVEQTREKVARSFATVLKLMDEYPQYKFMSSQPQLYVFLKERYPELYERVKQRIREGRWEPEGGMWVEADCNLTSGESLVRQFIHGKRFFKDEFGVDNRILWLPDVFGYSGALPQIMQKCGIDYFMTTKLAWNQFNRIPNDTFLWRGIDGTEILTHLVTTADVGQDVQKSFFTTYNGKLHPDSLIGGWQRYQNKDINNDILISYGYGDGGGGPTREMLENSTRLEKGVEGLPKVRQAFARTYFDELAARVQGNPRLNTWEGELYFEYHRGTYTSMARNKRSNRKAELHLMDLELLSVLASKQLDYPAQALDSLWKRVLINQFHDILPGSSIHEVYEVTKREYAAMEAEMADLDAERLRLLAGNGGELTVFNTKGFESSEVVTLGQCTAEALADDCGHSYPVQHTANGAIAYLPKLPAKGFVSLSPVQDAVAAFASPNPFALENGRVLFTPFYTVTFDAEGFLCGLFDKQFSREVLKANQRANLMRAFEDKPIYYDNWDIDIFYTEKHWDVSALTRMEWTELGPVRATLEIERPYSQSVIRQKIHFYADSRRIDFETTVDWHEHQQLLKVFFPVEV
ncbi:MAG: glycoside hydrolase family 38 C-terminal domain-containing protein, partial [Clostridia bacterium]